MTQEQFKRAVEINNKLNDLNETKKVIKEEREHRLWYAYKSGDFGSEWELTAQWAMRYISDILDKHDLMIR